MKSFLCNKSFSLFALFVINPTGNWASDAGQIKGENNSGPTATLYKCLDFQDHRRPLNPEPRFSSEVAIPATLTSRGDEAEEDWPPLRFS